MHAPTDNGSLSAADEVGVHDDGSSLCCECNGRCSFHAGDVVGDCVGVVAWMVENAVAAMSNAARVEEVSADDDVD